MRGYYVEKFTIDFKIAVKRDPSFSEIRAFQKSVESFRKSTPASLPSKVGFAYPTKNDHYEGQVNDKGVPHGKGVCVMGDGVVYDGEWVNGKRQGKGTQSWPNQSKYVGDFVNDKMEGRGVRTLGAGEIIYSLDGEGVSSGGEVFDGEWKADKFEGKGTIFSRDRTFVKVGVFVNNKMEGIGVMTSEECSYNGHWKEGRWGGKGSLSFPSGERYMGDWVDSKQEGRGVLRSASGDVYIGDWKNNQRNGNGTLIGTNGNRYVGEWVTGKKEGHGVEVSADGAVYDGQWKGGKKHGDGTEFDKDGKLVREGQWMAGKFV